MDFTFNEDQQLIAETASSVLASLSDSSAVREAMSSESGFQSSVWEQLSSELGWHLTHIPEQYDGLGMGYVELCVLFEQMGAHLLCAPFFSTSALAINALRVAGTEDQKKTYLSQIAAGETRISLAYANGNRVWGAGSVTAEYEVTASGEFVLNGQYRYVIDGHTADTLIVAAREQAKDGLAMFIVPVDSAGVERQWTPSMDQTRKLADVSMSNVTVSKQAIMLDEGRAEERLEQILALACIAVAAEQMGVAEKSLALTLDYIAERKQFGRAVGSFQAMKHKAADMMNKAEAARSAVYYAACIADEFYAGGEMGSELLEAASIAKAYCCEAAYFNSGTAIQMHGGVGFTWEYDVHLYFKRAKAAQVSFGDSAWHKERIATSLLGSVS